MNRRTVTILAALLSAPLLALVSPGPATALPAAVDIATGFAGPLQIDVGASGQVYVGQAFSGSLTKIRPNGTTKDLVSLPGQEIAGVASRGNDVAFTWTSTDPAHPGAELRLRKADGTVRRIANLLAFERRNNPDSMNTYGFKTLPASCAAQVPAAFNHGKPYTGVVDSHPYAVANAPDGGWYVADAGANVILIVSAKGKVRVSNIMHRIKVPITTDLAAAMGLPSCTVGYPYNLEPVPTDVEAVAGSSALYISLLPGGPEDLSAGLHGQVVRASACSGCGIDDLAGDQYPIGSRFAGASNVAVGGPGNRVYVSELFGDDILVRKSGVWEVFAQLPAPASIEIVGHTMFVAYDVFGQGRVATIELQGT